MSRQITIRSRSGLKGPAHRSAWPAAAGREKPAHPYRGRRRGPRAVHRRHAGRHRKELFICGILITLITQKNWEFVGLFAVTAVARLTPAVSCRGVGVWRECDRPPGDGTTKNQMFAIGRFFVGRAAGPPSYTCRRATPSPETAGGAGVRWTPLPQAEAPTEPTGETPVMYCLRSKISRFYLNC